MDDVKMIRLKFGIKLAYMYLHEKKLYVFWKKKIAQKALTKYFYYKYKLFDCLR